MHFWQKICCKNTIWIIFRTVNYRTLNFVTLWKIIKSSLKLKVKIWTLWKTWVFYYPVPIFTLHCYSLELIYTIMKEAYVQVDYDFMCFIVLRVFFSIIFGFFPHFFYTVLLLFLLLFSSMKGSKLNNFHLVLRGKS